MKSTGHVQLTLAELLEIINSAAIAHRNSIKLVDSPDNFQTGRVQELDDQDDSEAEYDARFSALQKAVDERLASSIQTKLDAVLKRIAELEAQVAAEKILNHKKMKTEKILNTTKKTENILNNNKKKTKKAT